VDSSCAVDGMLLGLHKVVCVSSKTKSSSNKRGSVRVNLLKLLMNTGGHNSVLNWNHLTYGFIIIESKRVWTDVTENFY
jgi:hypothetical protein